jgi:hypothetical protein
MEVKEEVRALLGPVAMQEQLGQVSGGLPGVLPTKVCVLLRLGGVEGHPGELGITSTASSCACFRASISASSASFSAASGPVNDRAEALPWALIGFAHLGFWILSGSRVGSKSSSLIYSA